MLYEEFLSNLHTLYAQVSRFISGWFFVLTIYFVIVVLLCETGVPTSIGPNSDTKVTGDFFGAH